MNLGRYSKEAFEFAFYPHHGAGAKGLIYVALKLCGEAGDLVTAVNRDDELWADELGDVLWYANAALREIGEPLCGLCNRKDAGETNKDVATRNIMILATCVSESVGKMLRDDGGFLTAKRRKALGDALYGLTIYVGAAAEAWIR